MANSKFRFELNPAGVRELLRGDPMVSVLKSYAQGVADTVGDADVFIGVNRANVSVRMKQNGADDDAKLLRAVGEQ